MQYVQNMFQNKQTFIYKIFASREYRIFSQTIISFFICFFLLMYVRESVFSCMIFEIEFLLELHLLRSPESDNHTFSGQPMHEYIINTSTKEKKKKKFQACHNCTTFFTHYYTYFKLLKVYFSLLLLTKDSFSQSQVQLEEKLKPPFLRLF